MSNKYVPQARCEAIALPMGYNGLSMSYDSKSPAGRVYGAMDRAFSYVNSLLDGYQIYFAGRRSGGSQADNHVRSARGTHDRKRQKPGWVQQGRRNNTKRTERSAKKRPAPGKE